MPWFLLIPVIIAPFAGFFIPNAAKEDPKPTCIEMHSGTHPPTCKDQVPQE